MEGPNKNAIDQAPVNKIEGAEMGKFSTEEYKEIVESLAPIQNEAKDLKQEINTLGPEAFAQKVMASAALKEKLYRFLENASAASYLIIALGATGAIIGGALTDFEPLKNMISGVEEFLKGGNTFGGDMNPVRLFALVGGILGTLTAPLMAKDYFSGLADKAKEKIESFKSKLGIA